MRRGVRVFAVFIWFGLCAKVTQAHRVSEMPFRSSNQQQKQMQKHKLINRLVDGLKCYGNIPACALCTVCIGIAECGRRTIAAAQRISIFCCCNRQQSLHHFCREIANMNILKIVRIDVSVWLLHTCDRSGISGSW